jgi:glycosyltransferase involved in cell wall biosynthesis
MAIKFNIPFYYYIIDQLDNLIPKRYLRWIGRGMIRNSIKKAQKIIVTNNGLLDYARSMGALSNQLIVISHGVDYKLYQGIDEKKVRKELGFQEDDIVLFFMGWLYDFCRLDIVADSLHFTNKNVKLLIVGKGELYNLLKTRSKNNNNIIIYDWKPFDELPKYIVASNYCILPFENNEITKNIVPIKICEYMAAGKPIITTKLPGIFKEFGNHHLIHYIQDPVDIINYVNNEGDGNIFKRDRENSSFIYPQSWDEKVNEFKSIILNKFLDSGK